MLLRSVLLSYGYPSLSNLDILVYANARHAWCYTWQLIHTLLNTHRSCRVLTVGQLLTASYHQTKKKVLPLAGFGGLAVMEVGSSAVPVGWGATMAMMMRWVVATRMAEEEGEWV